MALTRSARGIDGSVVQPIGAGADDAAMVQATLIDRYGSPLSQGNLATYRAIAFGYAAYATPTDMFAIWGSATKIIKVTHMGMAIHSTAAALQVIDFLRRSVANTSGTPTALTARKADSADDAATALVQTYAAAPTIDASGVLWATSEGSSGTATAAPGVFVLAGGGVQPAAANSVALQKPVVLRGIAEGLCMNYKSAALTVGFAALCIVEWTEQPLI